MQKIVIISVLLLAGSICFGQTKPAADTSKRKVVEASCGECQFKLPGKGCHLAVRFDGKAYFVDGTSIDDHGDAHGEDGFCEAIRHAEVEGKLENNRFKVTYFKLLPVKKEKE